MKEKRTVSIRPLKPGDGAFLCSIFKDNSEYYDIFFDSEAEVSEWENRVQRFLKQNDIHHVIMEANETAVGWFSFIDAEPTERELGILVIKKEYLHSGYGTEILRWFIEKCKAEHVHRLLLNVNKSNVRAIRFYKKFGFEIIAEERIPQCNDAVNVIQYKMKLELE